MSPLLLYFVFRGHKCRQDDSSCQSLPASQFTDRLAKGKDFFFLMKINIKSYSIFTDK